MKRRQLFEFNEAPWLPAVLRALITDFLATLVGLCRPYVAQLPLIARALKHHARVVDLCAGSGGPWRHLSPPLNALAGFEVPVALTDKFPPAGDGQKLAVPNVAWHPEPVDAARVPPALAGVRTLFNGFHQFTPETAGRILADAIDARQPIVVMELLQRRWCCLLLVLVMPLLVWLLTPWVRPFSVHRLLLTYVLPIAPVLLTWDMLVSMLRCYTPEELRAMARQAGGEDYTWFTGRYFQRGAPVTFLIGLPDGPAA